MLSSFAEGLQNGSAQRLDDITQSHDDEADALREEGVVGVVACPVTVEGRVWGAFAVGSRSGALSPDTEHRLVDFTELIGTAIANAESKAEINRLLELRASLRQVATLVARETPPDDIIPTVVDEIGRVLDADALLMTRFDPDGGSTVVATKGIPPSVLRIGERWAFSPRSATSEAVRTGRPVFRDDYSDLRLENSSDAAISAVGVRSTIAIPIVVDGRIWGSLGASLTRPERFPPDGVSHMANFAELLATAVSKARDRFQTLRLLEEQAALRRVATLVARGPSPTEVSTVVAEEVRRLPGVDDAAVCRYEPDGTSVLVVGLGDNLGRVPPGERSPIDEVSSTSEVWRTGRSARLDADRWADAPGPVAAGLRQLEVRSSVASPIVVDGRLWGTVILLSLREPLPSDTEQRLASFTELVAMAIGNAESRAELAASRARVVAASDETRRRIERDLHDGAQQRLVSLGLELRLAQAGVPDTLPELREGIGQIADELTDVVDELREMARGIHPAMLFEGGLRPALRTLARRAPIPVEVDIVTDARFAQQVEVAAYYVVSEALTNAARHASATLATVSVAERDGGLHIAVRDDGVGGADPRRGSGLIGLRDRIEALGGTVKVTSPAGAGTVVRVALPIEAGRLPVSGSRET
nr:putative sensor kinase [uncultured bacterium]